MSEELSRIKAELELWINLKKKSVAKSKAKIEAIKAKKPVIFADDIEFNTSVGHSVYTGSCIEDIEEILNGTW